jgi:uncharacterized surface protein with fasciclin (FAS1) repeats
MNRIRFMAAFLVFACLIAWSPGLMAQSIVKEQKAPTIVKYLVDASPEYSTMVKALNTADLTETLEGPGPFTLFAPSNKAFDVLPAGTVDNWLKPEWIDSLQKILTYHVISGTFTLAELEQKIKESGGEFVIPVIGESGKLSFVKEGSAIMIKDAQGFKSPLGAPVIRNNGLVYAIDKILLR